jgi:hypothetical protein
VLERRKHLLGRVVLFATPPRRRRAPSPRRPAPPPSSSASSRAPSSEWTWSSPAARWPTTWLVRVGSSGPEPVATAILLSPEATATRAFRWWPGSIPRPGRRARGEMLVSPAPGRDRPRPPPRAARSAGLGACRRGRVGDGRAAGLAPRPPGARRPPGPDAGPDGDDRRAAGVGLRAPARLQPLPAAGGRGGLRRPRAPGRRARAPARSRGPPGSGLPRPCGEPLRALCRRPRGRRGARRPRRSTPPAPCRRRASVPASSPARSKQRPSTTSSWGASAPTRVTPAATGSGR